MADWQMDRLSGATSKAEGRSAPRRTAGLGGLMRLVGTAISVALVLGLGVWAYQLAMRQIHGIPTISAPEGPARIAHEAPGGELAQHQGMAVNEIAALGEASPTADRLMLAPKAAELLDEDGISDALQSSLGTPLAAPDSPVTTTGEQLVQPSETIAALRPREDRLDEPLPDGVVEPIVTPDLMPATTLEGGEAPALGERISADIPGLTSSPRPEARPIADEIAEAAAMAVAEAMAPQTHVDLDAAVVASGTQLVQLGSYDTEAQAKLEWEKIALRFGALMEGKQRVIQEAEAGGRRFFRLRVSGFEDRDAATLFCSAVKAESQCVLALAH
ncbi:MAG: SPOR domain-containing protein [Albidovulum sp.]